MITEALWRTIYSKPTKDCNAVIEGAYPDSWSEFTYKLAHLPIDESWNAFTDGTYKYSMHPASSQGRIEERSQALSDLPSLPLLCWCPGVVLPYHGGVPDILDRPRSVFLKDGRTFVEENMISNRNYCDLLPQLRELTADMLAERQFSDLYDHVVANKSVDQGVVLFLSALRALPRPERLGSQFGVYLIQ